MLAKKLSPLLSQSFVRPATLQHVRHINTVDRLDSLFSNGYSAAKERKILLSQKSDRMDKSYKEQQAREQRVKILEKYQTREWKFGDVYAPHDLSAAEMRKWRKQHSPNSDVFDALAINPLDLYKNFSVMSEYMTEMGRIKPRSVTGLRPVNQRRMAKAIRRAVGLGLMPSVYQHPEILLMKRR